MTKNPRSRFAALAGVSLSLFAGGCATARVGPETARPPPSGAAGAELRAMSRSGALDADAVEASLAAAGDRRSQVAPSGPALTARELDVLRLLARGRTNKEIAQQLRISDRTVQHHTIHIYGKLGVDTRAAAALHAARQGLLEPE